GEFKPIPSKLPGVPVNELLPRVAQVMDKVCLVRTLTHTMKNHNSATYYSLTGHAPPLDDIRLRDSLDLFPAYGALVDKLAAAQGIDQTYQKAIAMLTSPKVKEAFDLAKEPTALRERYGRTTYGQSCLLARRLVEAGCKFVNVYFSSSIGGGGPPGGWDTHG